MTVEDWDVLSSLENLFDLQSNHFICLRGEKLSEPGTFLSSDFSRKSSTSGDRGCSQSSALRSRSDGGARGDHPRLPGVEAAQEGPEVTFSDCKMIASTFCNMLSKRVTIEAVIFLEAVIQFQLRRVLFREPSPLGLRSSDGGGTSGQQLGETHVALL